jgi:hypothetical protein
MSGSLPLPEELRRFVESCRWTFARTMPVWPHEYIVRERVDEGLFVALVEHIRAHGYEGHNVIGPVLRMRWLPCVFGALPISTAVINRNCFPYDTHGRLQTLNSA